MAADSAKVVPLTCHGHSRPVTHMEFSFPRDDTDQYYLISACKDGNPMLRDGITGDWIGTFIGHKGAVWQARLSRDAALAITASADFSAKVWDTFTGECIQTLQHAHIVRSVAFPNRPNPTVVATGGAEKKLRIFDISRGHSASPAEGELTNGATTESKAAEGYEIAPGTHGNTIKSIVWDSNDPNLLATVCDDGNLRWFDLRGRDAIGEYKVGSPIGTCELDIMSIDGTGNVLSVAAGNSVHFFDGLQSRQLMKTVELPYPVVSVSLDQRTATFVAGGTKDTWARIYDFHSGEELELSKGHHGPIWTISFSPDGKLYATGSEDGTIKLWKYCKEPYGLWR